MKAYKYTGMTMYSSDPQALTAQHEMYNKKKYTKKLKISELRLPAGPNFKLLVPNPSNALGMSQFKNFNVYSQRQLSEYQVVMMEKWGNITLTLTYSDSYRVEYNAKFASNYRKMLRASEVGIYNSINE